MKGAYVSLSLSLPLTLQVCPASPPLPPDVSMSSSSSSSSSSRATGSSHSAGGSGVPTATVPGASYDQLLWQVELLKMENSTLRQELQHNSSHLCKLESEASNMKVRQTHTQVDAHT